MPTFVAMLRWSGRPQPQPAAVRAAIDARSYELREAGLHSVVFLPDEGACAGIMVAACETPADAARLAASILPGSDVTVDAMPFDDDLAPPAWLARGAPAECDDRYLHAVLEAVIRD